MHTISSTKYFSWMARTEKQKVASEISQVYIELSTHCNLACKSCVRHSIEHFKFRHFTKHAMRRLIPMLKSLPNLQRVVLLGFGETLCNPYIIFHLTSLKECGASIVLVSNAHFITSEIADFFVSLPLDELWLSWDDSPDTPIIIRKGASASSFADKILLIHRARASVGSLRPVIGMEIVAMKSNAHALPEIIAFGNNAGIEKFIVSNIFPYSEAMKDEALYEIFENKIITLQKILKKQSRSSNIVIANQRADVPRKCPFIERGTAFITVAGDIAPCPELAYTHPAWYFGSKRLHRQCTFGNIAKNSLDEIWRLKEFSDFRKKFEYYDFPDCATCREPDMCWHRTVDIRDCYWNDTPCGECLWAKGIVLCP